MSKKKSLQSKRRPPQHNRQDAPQETRSQAKAPRREDSVPVDEVEFAAIEQKVLQYMRGLVSGVREPKPTTLNFSADLLREFWPFFESETRDWHNNRVCDLRKLADIEDKTTSTVASARPADHPSPTKRSQAL